MAMESLEIIKSLLFGLLLGASIGLERERISQKYKTAGFAGLRTFALFGMFGALLPVFESLSPILFYIFAGGLSALIVTSYVLSTLKNKDLGGTTEIALFVILAAGYLVGIGETILATIMTIITLIMLYSKETLHKIASKITKEEMNSIIQFFVVWLIVLPLLPNANFGPYDALNPYVIWLMVVLISAISFFAYLGIKLLGANRGISLTGFLGGLVSSTAVSLAFSQNSKKYKKVVWPFVFGIVIASTAMFFRVLIEVAVVNPELVSKMWIPLVASGATGGLFCLFIWKKFLANKKMMKTTKMPESKPIDLVGAIKFGALFAIILLVSKAASVEFGEKGIYITSVISGLVDADAITVTLANLARNGLSDQVAVTGITLATVTNTIVKGGIVLSMADKRVALRTFGIMAAMAIVGLLSLLVIF